MNTPALVKVLLDTSARLDERDDAAVDLGEAESLDALAALISVASRQEESDYLLSSCGESIAQIWLRRGKYDSEAWARLAPAAKHEVVGLVGLERPEWVEQLFKSTDDFPGSDE